MCRPPSVGLWDRPSLVKPTDSTGRTAVHRSSALPLTAQMWDKQIPLFVYTWSLCMYCACLLAFCVRVVFRWSPMTAIVLHGHRFLKFWRLAADGPPEVLWVHATMSIFKRQLHFSPLIEQDCTWCLGLQFLYLRSTVIKCNTPFILFCILFYSFSCIQCYRHICKLWLKSNLASMTLVCSFVIPYWWDLYLLIYLLKRKFFYLICPHNEHDNKWMWCL